MNVSWLSYEIAYKMLKLENLLIIIHLQLDHYDHVLVLFFLPCEFHPLLWLVPIIVLCRLEAEWEVENSQRVMDTYFRANTLVRYYIYCHNMTFTDHGVVPSG